jgi:hypothetical protein
MDVSCQFLTTDTLLPEKEPWYHLMGGGVDHRDGLDILQRREISYPLLAVKTGMVQSSLVTILTELFRELLCLCGNQL